MIDRSFKVVRAVSTCCAITRAEYLVKFLVGFYVEAGVHYLIGKGRQFQGDGHAADEGQRFLCVLSLTRIAKIALVLFATIFLCSSFPVQSVHSKSFSNLPFSHAAFLNGSSYDAVFRPSTASSSLSDAVATSGVTVGPNVRVNGPQFPAPNGLLRRSETTIAVGQDGSRMAAGRVNSANAVLRHDHAVSVLCDSAEHVPGRFHFGREIEKNTLGQKPTGGQLRY